MDARPWTAGDLKILYELMLEHGFAVEKSQAIMS
jgi:hypothetical protein